MKCSIRCSLATTAAALGLAAALASCGGGGGGGGGGGAGIGIGAPLPPTTAQLPEREALIARARPLELNTPYVPPPGNVLEHHTSGYAKTMCSAVFITGIDPDVAAESLGYFVGPYDQRKNVGKPVVDRVKKEVRISIPNGPTLVARHFGSQGCVTLPAGRDDVFFTPVEVRSALPDPATQPWPMGDVLPGDAPPAEVDMAKVTRAVDAAFAVPEAYTSALVVTHKGRIVAERYMSGIGPATPLESWSMGKSVVATMMGVLIKQGVYKLDQPAPIPEWQGADDARQQIKISDILQMSSGLRIKAPDDPDFDPNGTYPDHIYYYTGRINAFNYAATRPQQWPPGAVGRYRNTDPVLANYLVRLAVEKRGEDYLSFPQRVLFDKIGIRSMVIETDPYGNFHAGLRLHVGARLGAPGQSLPAGRHVEWRAHSSRGLRQLREQRGTGLGRGQAPDLRRLLLDQRDGLARGAGLGLLHARRRRPVRAGGSVARPGRGADRAFEGERFAGSTLNQALALLTAAVPRVR